ncbi:proteolipid protein 2 [Dryobates pubescens]|uniref:proteolipid protein 2 n=1 Tax=Dryobates pubescens TaxID=118200 RepID=UPI0023B8B531|nr:proteolipid protein 2 [Dryobates pubescens]
MEPSGSQSGPRACLGFSRTHKGLVLIGEIALCVLALVCYGASRTPGYASLAVCELVFAALMLAVWGCGLAPRMPIIHWGWTDFIRCLVGSLLFLITSLIVIIGHRDGAGTAAGVFGLLAGLLLAYDGYLTLPRRGGRSAAGAGGRGGRRTAAPVMHGAGQAWRRGEGERARQGRAPPSPPPPAGSAPAHCLLPRPSVPLSLRRFLPRPAPPRPAGRRRFCVSGGAGRV